MRIYGLVLGVLLIGMPVGLVAGEVQAAVDFPALERRWEEARKVMGLPGVSIAIVQGDGVVYEHGFGHRSVEPKAAFSPQTPSYVASVTKTFTSFAIMQLVDDGKVGLDVPVVTYLPRFQLSDADLTARITLRDLLCHRYGLSNWPIGFAEAYSGLCDDDFFYRELPHTKIKGTWEYDNLHFTLLGRVVEAVSGQPWQEYLRDHVFVPAGMTRTTGRASELYAFADVAQPLTFEKGTWAPATLRKHDTTMHAAGGLGASVRDLATWIRLHLNGGVIDSKRLLSEAGIQEILTPQVNPDTEFWRFGRKQMGLAWYLGDYKDDLLVHHFGSYIGAHAHVSFMPQHKIGVAVIANSDEDMSMFVHRMAADVYDAFLGRPLEDSMQGFAESMRDIAARQAEQDEPRRRKLNLPLPLKTYAGVYNSEQWRTLVLEVRDDTLVGHVGQLEFVVFRDHSGEIRADSSLGDQPFQFSESNGAISEACIGKESNIMRFVREAIGSPPTVF